MAHTEVDSFALPVVEEEHLVVRNAGNFTQPREVRLGFVANREKRSRRKELGFEKDSKRRDDIRHIFMRKTTELRTCSTAADDRFG